MLSDVITLRSAASIRATTPRAGYMALIKTPDAFHTLIFERLPCYESNKRDMMEIRRFYNNFADNAYTVCTFLPAMA